MKLLDKLKRYLVQVNITNLKVVPTPVDAASQGYHAAIWGNYLEAELEPGVAKIGKREVMAFKVSDRKLLMSLTQRDKNVIEAELRQLNFVWSGDLMVFHPTRCEEMTFGAIVHGALKVPLGCYYLKK